MAPLHQVVHILPEAMIQARRAGDETCPSEFAPLDAELMLLDNLAWWTATLAAGRKSS